MRPPVDRRVDDLLREPDRIQHQLVQVLARFLELAEQVIAHRAQLLAAELLVQIVRRAAQLVRAVVALELQDAVLNLAPVHDQDREHAVVRQRHELDLAQRRMALPRQRHDAGQARDAGQHLRGRGDQRLRIVGMLAEARLDRGDLVVLERLELEQRVDEEAIALVGRDAAGGGVRRGRRSRASSRSAMTLRIVAALRFRPRSRDSVREPTGWPSRM